MPDCRDDYSGVRQFGCTDTSRDSTNSLLFCYRAPTFLLERGATSMKTGAEPNFGVGDTIVR